MNRGYTSGKKRDTKDKEEEVLTDACLQENDKEGGEEGRERLGRRCLRSDSRPPHKLTQSEIFIFPSQKEITVHKIFYLRRKF